MTINQKIFYYRKQSGLTQANVAEKMNIKLNTYSKMEREGKITIERLVAIANILGIKPSLLIDDEDSAIVLPNELRENKESEPEAPEPLFKQPDFSENTLTLEAPRTSPFKFPEYTPTNRELSAMKQIHNLPKPAQDKIYNFIHEVINENSKSKK